MFGCMENQEQPKQAEIRSLKHNMELGCMCLKNWHATGTSYLHTYSVWKIDKGSPTLS